jgi:hypothetical protein
MVHGIGRNYERNEAQILFQKHCENVNKTYRALEIRDLRKNHFYSINISLRKILESFWPHVISFLERKRKTYEKYGKERFFSHAHSNKHGVNVLKHVANKFHIETVSFRMEKDTCEVPETKNSKILWCLCWVFVTIIIYFI